MRLLDAEFRVIRSEDIKRPRVPIGVEGPIAGWAVPPLTNVYCDGEESPIYCWFQLTWGPRDLDIVECYHDIEGDAPEWLMRQEEEWPMSDVIRSAIGWGHLARVEWGLQHGIGIGQPFCIEFEPPEWYECGSYEYGPEWDISWDWRIVHIMPRKPENVAKSWQRYLDMLHKHDARVARHTEIVRAKRERDTSALYIRRELFFAGSYDDQSPPDGVRLYLCSRHQRFAGRCYFPASMMSAEERHWNDDTAFSKLTEKAREVFPGLDLNKLSIYSSYYPPPL